MQKRKDVIKDKSALIRVLIFFLLTAGSVVFSLLCLNLTKVSFFVKRKTLSTVFICLFFSLLCAVSLWTVYKEKTTFTKSLISVYAFILFCLGLLFVLQKTGFFVIVQDEQAFQAFLERFGIWMPILYILLQYLQVVILPIPSIVSTLAGVALFGAFYAMVYSLIGIILGSLTAFFIGKKLGFKAVAWLVGEDTLFKWQKKLKGKDNFILTAMFLLPLFPDDILCFLAGLSSMSVKYFIVMIILTRLIGIFATCYSIDFIPCNTWWGLLAWGVIFVVIALTFYLVYKNMEKLQAWYSKLYKKSKKNK